MDKAIYTDSNEYKSPDLEKLRDAGLGYGILNNHFAYLNINSLRNKVTDLKEILGYLPPDYLVLFKTKLDDSFPSTRLSYPNYDIRAGHDKDKNGGGLVEFVKRVHFLKY